MAVLEIKLKITVDEAINLLYLIEKTQRFVDIPKSQQALTKTIGFCNSQRMNLKNLGSLTSALKLLVED